MKGALVTFVAEVEGVVKDKFSGAPPQTPKFFVPPPNKNSCRRHCLESLIGSTVNLKSQIRNDCKDESIMEVNGLECVISRVFEDVGKLVELLKKEK